MHFDTAQLVSLLVGIVLPLISGLVTKRMAGGAWRAVTLLVLAAATSFLSSWVDALDGGNPFDWRTALVTVAGTFLVGVGVHFGLYKPTGASNQVTGVAGFIGPRGANAQPRSAHATRPA